MGLVPFEAQTPSATNPPSRILGHTQMVINDLVEQQRSFSQLIRRCEHRAMEIGHPLHDSRSTGMGARKRSRLLTVLSSSTSRLAHNGDRAVDLDATIGMGFDGD
jgi:hypothetical protein